MSWHVRGGSLAAGEHEHVASHFALLFPSVRGKHIFSFFFFFPTMSTLILAFDLRPRKNVEGTVKMHLSKDVLKMHLSRVY